MNGCFWFFFSKPKPEPLTIDTEDSSLDLRNDTDSNEFFMSFIFDNRQRFDHNRTRKMTVNNNFKGDHLFPSQVYIENDNKAKQVPSPNIQLINDKTKKVAQQKVVSNPSLFNLLRSRVSRFLPLTNLRYDEVEGEDEHL